MSKRQNVKTIPTPELQGDDSWVKLKMPTVEQFNHMLELQRESEAATLAGDKTKMADMEFAARAAMSLLVIGWNWVDDDDEPLPQPAGNPEVFGKLTMEEIRFIGNHLNPDAQKNNGGTSSTPR